MFCSARRNCGFATLVLLSALLSSCAAQKDVGPPPRYAIVSFENLTGDPALDWVSRGASEYLSLTLAAVPGPGTWVSTDALDRADRGLGGHAANAPGITAERAAALANGANRIISGYVERTANGVHITASEENPQARLILRTRTANAAQPFEALGVLSHSFSAGAGAPPTENAEAFRIYSTALVRPVSEAAPMLESAVTLDPGFGRAWAALAQAYASLGDKAHAGEVIARARAQKLSPIDTARLELQAASLAGDRKATLAALRKVYAASPSDVDLGRSLAQSETAIGNFAQAATAWKNVTATLPDDVNAWNQLGYALAWSGDYAGALAALREYAKLRPGEANPLDSQGDIHYWFGKYADAAAAYKAANAKSSGFLNGGELYKAAWATFLAGDKAGADALFVKFKDVRDKADDATIIRLQGDWLYRTGRRKEAEDLLRAPLKQASPRVAAQLAVWDLQAGNRAAAPKEFAAGTSTGVTPGELLVRFATLQSGIASDWDARAAHTFVGQLAALRLSALGYALVLDGKKQAAIPVWQQVVAQSPATDFFARAMLARLQGKPIEHAAPPDPVNLNPFASVLDSL